MAGNNFFFNGDPLLGGNNNSFEQRLAELGDWQKAIEQRRMEMVQAKEQMQQQQPSQSRTPVWDEIDSIVKNMSDKEFDLVTNSDEFLESQKVITDIINAQYMAMMRPIVEGTQAGKDALENHLTIVKRLRKVAASEVDKEVADFAEYKEKYSDIPYSEYLKMKKETKKPKR